MRSFADILDAAVAAGRSRYAVAQATDSTVLEAMEDARQRGFAHGILVGPRQEIEQAARASRIPIAEYTIVEPRNGLSAASAAVRLVARGEAEILVKGHLQSAEFLHAVLDRENGLSRGRLLSHVGVFHVPGFDRFLLITDAGLTIAPDLAQKAEIVQNAIDFARQIGIQSPVAAILCAVENVNPHMPATLDAACLSKMADRGAITGGKVEGPLALDNAISEESARHKGITSPLAGKADILVAPDIEAANILYKALVFLANAEDAGIVAGAKAPIVMPSRSDSAKNKLYALALAAIARERAAG